MMDLNENFRLVLISLLITLLVSAVGCISGQTTTEPISGQTTTEPISGQTTTEPSTTISTIPPQVIDITNPNDNLMHFLKTTLKEQYLPEKIDLRQQGRDLNNHVASWDSSNVHVFASINYNGISDNIDAGVAYYVVSVGDEQTNNIGNQELLNKYLINPPEIQDFCELRCSEDNTTCAEQCSWKVTDINKNKIEIALLNYINRGQADMRYIKRPPQSEAYNK